MRLISSRLWRAIAVGLALIPSLTRGADQDGVAARDASAPAGDLTNLSGDTCWVFTHMNKAGGTTVKRLLRPFLDESGIAYSLYDSPQWKLGVDYLKTDFLKRNSQLVWGAYTEGEENGATPHDRERGSITFCCV